MSKLLGGPPSHSVRAVKALANWTTPMPVFDVYDDRTPRRAKIDAERVTFGRTADNALVVDDRQASRQHCEVRLTQAGFVLCDLNSRNGTRLNQDPVDEPVPLHDGDEIGIGKATIRFWSSASRIDKSAPKLPLVATASSSNAAARSGRTQARRPAPARPVAAPQQPPPQAVRPPKEPKRPATDTKQDTAATISLVEVDEPVDYSEPSDSGPPPQLEQLAGVDVPVKINDVIPLNQDGKPAHPVGKDASEVSGAMLRLKQLLLRSFQLRATDIHVEPKQEQLDVRYRIDGYLHQVGNLDYKTAKSVYSIVKLLCNLDISKKDIMQDGSFAVKLPGRRVDLRVSIAPSTLGDKMVIRVLDKSLAPEGLDSLGMDGYILEQVRQNAYKGSSMLVVCGPTGSGKTTTVYGIVQEMNSRTRNIVTVEDPVEYKLDSVTQIQVNPRRDITFASALTSLLRQDPDVILIGEMRDAETARMAVQSAMTGHLVLSTVHARDSIGCIFRLLDLGVEAFMLGSALTAVLSQRLLRKLCPECKMKIKPAMKDLSRMGLEELGGTDLYAPVGCDACMQIGHKGRSAVFELLSITDQVRDAIVTRPTIQQLRVAAGDWIFQTLRQDGLRKLRQGLVSLDEFSMVLARD